MLIFGEVLSRLLFLPELLAGAFFLTKLSLTKLLTRLAAPEDAWECGLPVLLAIDCDLELGESTELPFPLKECNLLEISLILAFFLDWSISICTCLILACAFRSLFLDASTFRLKFSISLTCFCRTFFWVRS